MSKPLKPPVMWPRRLLLLAAVPLLAWEIAGAEPPRPDPNPTPQSDNKAVRTPKGVAAFEGDGIRLRALPRTTQQIKAFYEARGFPKSALAEFENKCFLTVSVRNRGQDIVWMEPSNWHYRVNGGQLKRLDLAYWDSVWERINLKRAYRATFRWTQLPDSRDLRPSEPVGGNVVLPYTDKPITVEARFARGADKSGEPLSVKIENLHCGG